MTRLFLLLLILFSPAQVLAELGVVIKVDVCGSGNLRTDGFEKITSKEDESGEFFLIDCQGKVEKAIKILCDKP